MEQSLASRSSETAGLEPDPAADLASAFRKRAPALKPAAGPSPLNGCTERLRMVVHRSGGTKQVAARAGIALSTLGAYLAGGEMKLTTAMQLCEACNVSLAWLVGDESPSGLDQRAGPTARYVPVRCLRPEGASRNAPGGRPGDAPGDATGAILEHVVFSSAWLRSQLDRAPEDLLAFEAQGKAMEPTITQGDLLLVDTSAATISSLDMHVIEIGGELLVRRLERVPDGGIIIRTDNDRFPPQTINKSGRDALKLVGRVVWKGSRAPL